MWQAEQKRMWRSFRCYLELKGSLHGRRQWLSSLGSPQADPRKQTAQRAQHRPHASGLAYLARLSASIHS